MLEYIQGIFFAVSTVGVIVATLNHYWFVKDRNAQTLVSITNLLRESHAKFLKFDKEEQLIGTNALDFYNVLTVYCHMHNKSQIRKNTKRVHEEFIAGMLELFSADDVFKGMEPIIPRSRSQKTETLIFIENNPTLFENHSKVVSYFESGFS